jgi:alkylation response protein AidB-like acyl-CoA dehydrogenase
MVESDEAAMIRAAVRKIAQAFGHRYYVERARAGGKTDELWAALGESGFLGVNLPEEFGGGGLGVLELSIVAEEIAAAGCPLLMLIVSPAICGTLIARFGTPEQKQAWLPGLASGEKKMAFAITEPDAGSNTHRLQTSAMREGDGWVLRGTKYYTSGVDEADAVLVVARTGDANEATGRGLLSLFIVDTDVPGFKRSLLPVEITAPEKQFTLFFDDVVLPSDAILGEADNGLREVFFGLNPERIMSAATCNGIGRYALDRGAAYARDRRVWDVAIGSHQGLAHPLAEAYVDVTQAQVMTTRAAWLYDHGYDAGEAANIAKMVAADASVQALDRAIQIHGGNGMSSEFGLADMWGMARSLQIAPVSREMILNYISQHSLGLPRSY